jgi:hypothetical protein
MRLLVSPDDFEVNVYNALLSVEEADGIVRNENKIDQFLSQAQDLFLLHNMQARFGAALLHNHFFCESGELIVQNADVLNGERVLITKPQTSNTAKENMVPCLWAFAGNKFHPLEFATDGLACNLFYSDTVPQAFLNDFGDLLTSSPVGGLFGLAVVERSLYRQAKSEESPLEYSDSENRENIIYLRNEPNTNSIETAWAFQEYVDPTLGCDTVTSCTQACRRQIVTRCVSLNGGHKKVAYSLHGQHHGQSYKHT